MDCVLFGHNSGLLLLTNQDLGRKKAKYLPGDDLYFSGNIFLFHKNKTTNIGIANLPRYRE